MVYKDLRQNKEINKSMMTDTPPENEKKKGKPGQNWACFILLVKLVVAIFVIGHLAACAYWSMMFAVYLIKYPYLTSHEVSATCSLLALPRDSTFCIETDRQTGQSLEELLEELYPIGMTTVQDLEESWEDIECGLTTCSLSLPGAWSMFMRYEKDSNLITEYQVGRND